LSPSHAGEQPSGTDFEPFSNPARPIHIAANVGCPDIKRMENAMTKSKITTVALTALSLAVTFAATSGNAQAHPRFGWGIGAGFAAGALIGAAAASNAYPVYVTPGYRDCRLIERYDRWGNLRVIRVCDGY
jgi:hypothetical protein